MLRERIRPTLFVAAIIVATTGLVAGGLAAPATAATSPSTAVAKILADTNALRIANGKAALAENPAIDQVAQAWAAQMGAAGTMSHNPSYSTQVPTGWKQVGENVATGYAYDRVVSDGWANSPDHLANMLGDYTDIGIGYWESPSGVTYFVQDFGAYASGSTSSTPAATSSPTPSPTPSATASPTATSGSTATAGASMPNLPTIPWSGGPAYYAQFPVAKAGGWTDPSFFPIGVWYGKPSHAATLASLGINTYVNAEHDGSPISMITNEGISVIAGDEWTPAEVKGNNKVVGWQVSDECEMAMGPCATGGEAGALATQKSLVAPFRAYNDGRFLQANFSNGALGTWWAPNTMGQHVGLMDVTSVDKYAYTNPEADYVISQAPTWPKGKNPDSAAAYGWLQDRMETYSSKPNWVIVETAKPYLDDPSARTIQPDQIEGAVWNAIIHGATGITYFQHNNNGCGNYSIVECGATLQNKIKAIDSQVKSLAPVINTQSYVWNFGSGLDTSLKIVGGYAYIFAMTDGSTGTKTFTLPAGLSGSVQVVDENRTVTANNGVFGDAFAAEYSHHIYKVALTGAAPATGNDAPPVGGGSSSAPSSPVPSRAPVGWMDSASLSGSTLTASGWSIDPDTASPVQVQLVVDGSVVVSGSAGTLRSGLSAAVGMSALGDRHGYALSSTLSLGRHTVCVVAVNDATGPNTTLSYAGPGASANCAIVQR
ncbi:CAP domain-containing protein [Pseudolysinimonas sp.]|uniref:CAP domain-containing protein n=1 Tax=Pseudolysinimonas sp. TaxID=2680009 RepID=UPI003F80E0D4